VPFLNNARDIRTLPVVNRAVAFGALGRRSGVAFAMMLGQVGDLKNWQNQQQGIPGQRPSF
jgi:hypothetical protein